MRGNRVAPEPVALEFWRSLNPTERYFALLAFREKQAQVTEKEHEQEWDEGSEPPDLAGEFGLLQPVFQPYSPEWQTVYSRPMRHARQGTHIFKATLTGWRGGGGGIWRRLAVPAEANLEELALAILQAFKTGLNPAKSRECFQFAFKPILRIISP